MNVIPIFLHTTHGSDEEKKSRTAPEASIAIHVSSRSGAEPAFPSQKPLVRTEGVNFYYGEKQVLFDVSIDIPERKVTSFIGPSGCGKSTLLRCINRMNELVDRTRMEGIIEMDGQDIYDPDMDVIHLRKRVGMVFQKSNPFPKSIFENVAYGLRVAGVRNKKSIAETVEQSLKQAALWEEVHDRLNESALGLSGGQQQRLCIARAIATEPEIILMDEPASALDPLATGKVEDLILDLSKQYTIIIVTHNMQQAARISDFTAFFYMGRLIEYGPTQKLFTNPEQKQTEDYVTGRFG